MPAKIIEFPGQWRCIPEATQRDGALMPPVLHLAIEPIADGPRRPISASARSDDSLADLHRAIIGLLGWDDSHNYFFSQGSCRYEDPLLFASHDPVSARCRRIYCAGDVSLGLALGQSAAPLYYVYNLTRGYELKITLADAAAIKQFG